MAISKTINIWQDSKFIGHMIEALARTVVEKTLKGAKTSRDYNRGTTDAIFTDIILPDNKAYFEIKARTKNKFNTGSSFKFSEDERNAVNKKNGFAVLYGYEINENKGLGLTLSKKDLPRISFTITNVRILHAGEDDGYQCIKPSGYPDIKKTLDPNIRESFDDTVKAAIDALEKLQGTTTSIMLKYHHEGPSLQLSESTDIE